MVALQGATKGAALTILCDAIFLLQCVMCHVMYENVINRVAADSVLP